MTYEDLDPNSYDNYKVMGCHLCATCDFNTVEFVNEGLNGVSKNKYPFCKRNDLHMIWMKDILENNECYNYIKDGVS